MRFTLKAPQGGCPMVLVLFQMLVPPLVIFWTSGTVSVLAPSSARPSVTILPLLPEHQGLYLTPLSHYAQGLLPGSHGASSGHCSPGSAAFLQEAHPLLSLPRKITILVMGLDNAGKTSVIMDIEKGEEQHSLRGSLFRRQQLADAFQPSAQASKD